MAKEKPKMQSAFDETAEKINLVKNMLESKANIVEIPLSLITPPKTHDRKCFDFKEIEDLAQSIKTSGLLQPIVVRKTGVNYERLIGFKRVMATKLNNETSIKTIVLEGIDDEQAALITISENLFRSNPNVYDQTQAFLDYTSIALKMEASEIIKLLNKYKAGRQLEEDENEKILLLEEKISHRLLIKLRTFADRIKVLNINPLLIEAIQKRELTYQTAMLIDNAKDEAAIKELIEKTVRDSLSCDQVKELLNKQNKKTWDHMQILPSKYKKAYKILPKEKQKEVDDYLLKIEKMFSTSNEN